MKITDEEIAAARQVFDQYGNTLLQNAAIGHALLAALRVRKERKRAKKDANLPTAADVRGIFCESDSIPPPKPLTFEPGKSYRTRDGQKVCLEKSGIRFLEGTLYGKSACWYVNGKYYRDGESARDLVALWED